MDETQRLELIAETVRYAQRAKTMGAPASVYSKAIREAIHFIWERRSGKPKHSCAQYRSVRLGEKDRAIYDHVVPMRFLIKDLMDLENASPGNVAAVLLTAGPICLITHDEDELLRKAGLGRSTPDRNDPFSRYRVVGIEVRSL